MGYGLKYVNPFVKYIWIFFNTVIFYTIRFAGGKCSQLVNLIIKFLLFPIKFTYILNKNASKFISFFIIVK